MKSDQINEIASALSKAQGKIKGAVKDSANPFFKSCYADLQSVWDAIREAFVQNGLAVTQTMEQSDSGQLYLLTTLMHSSGQWIDSKFPIVPLKNEPQALGSATSYARRYSLAAIAGVYQTDDDGEAAQARAPAPQVKATFQAPQPVPALQMIKQADPQTQVEMGAMIEQAIAKGTGNLGAPFDLILQKGPHKGKQIQALTLEQAKQYFEEINGELGAMDRSPATLRGPSREVYYALQSFIQKGGK